MLGPKQKGSVGVAGVASMMALSMAATYVLSTSQMAKQTVDAQGSD